MRPNLLDLRVPDVSPLIELEKDLAEYTTQFDGNSLDVLSKVWNIQKDQTYKQLWREAEGFAKAAVYYTICALSQEFNLGFKGPLPSVEIVDVVRYHEFTRQITLDDFQAPFLNFTLTAFHARGRPYFNHPEGPVISLYLPTIDKASIIEESFHFLHWFYETDPSEKGIRSPNVDEGLFKPENEEGKIVFENNGVARAHFVPPTIEECFSSHIVRETVAYFIRSLLSLDDEVVLEGHDTSRYSTTLIDFLMAGREKSYKTLLGVRNVNSFDDVLKVNGLSRFTEDFPQDVIHLLGYSLGKALQLNTVNRAEVEEITNVAFVEGNPNEKLDVLVDIFHRRQRAKVFSNAYQTLLETHPR